MHSRRYDNADDGAWVDDDEPARYGAFTLEDGSVIIYDTLNDEAWIQSDVGRQLRELV